MEDTQLIPQELVTATLLATPVTVNVSPECIVSEGHPQSLQVLSDSHHIPEQESVVCGDEIIHIEPGQSLIQANGDNLWMNSQIQYVMIQGDSAIDNDSQTTTALANEHQTTSTCIDGKAGTDRLQCGLCGKMVNSVIEFLHHKSSHVARGMGLGCEICGLSFSRQVALTEHYKRKHRICLVQKKTVDKPSTKKQRKARTDLQLSQGKAPVSIHLDEKLREAGHIDQNMEISKIHEEYSRFEKPSDMNTKEDDMSVEVTNTSMKHHVKVGESSDLVTNLSDRNLQGLVDVVTEDKVGEDNAIVVGESDPINVLDGSAEENIYDTLKNDGHESVDNVECVVQNPDILESSVDEVSATVMEEITEPVDISVNNVQTEVCDIEMHDMGNSNSSEKENNADEKDKEENFTLNHNQKLADSASDKLIKLSHNIKELAQELNMPDFHFIPVIERKVSKHLHAGKYTFKCLYCDLKVSWRSTLCRHMREKHADILKVGPLLSIPKKLASEHEVMKMSDYIRMETRPSGKRVRGIESQDLPGEFLCDKCDKIFHRLRYLRKHQIVHRNEKNLLCNVCVKSFKTTANLKQHMKTHKDREAYKCSECDFESTVNIAIHTHRQMHSQGCVLCEICGSAYSDKSTLTKHKQVHNPLRPFACQYPGCTWRFKTNAMCVAHFRAHISRGKFECSVCGYAFRQKHHLQRHEKKVHNMVITRTSNFNYMEPASVNYSKEQDITRMVPSTVEAVQEVSLVVNEGNEVNVDAVDDQFDLESALQTGQLVIATEDGNTINYEMSDIGMNMSYQTLLQDSDGNQLDAHTILIPQSDGSHIIYQHEVTETVNSEEKTKPLMDVSINQT